MSPMAEILFSFKLSSKGLLKLIVRSVKERRLDPALVFPAVLSKALRTASLISSSEATDSGAAEA